MAGRRRSERALRAVLVRSPGRPGVVQRESRCRFWAAIAEGASSEEARTAVFEYIEVFYNCSSQSTSLYVVDWNRFC